MTGLAGKVALITGAGQGIGQGIAYALAGEGVAVAVAGRTKSKLDATVQQIGQRGGRALAIECDVRDPAALAACVDAAVTHLGRLDILVNNAQEPALGTLEQLSDAEFIAGWESGPLAAFRLMKLCRPHLRNGGCIVNLASQAGKQWDMTGSGGYAAVKEAMRQLTRAAACEWAAEGIRTNAILPLAFATGMQRWAAARPDEYRAFIDKTPMKRAGDCEHDIGRFVVALCSDDCRYINGQSIGVDGGMACLG